MNCPSTHAPNSSRVERSYEAFCQSHIPVRRREAMQTAYPDLGYSSCIRWNTSSHILAWDVLDAMLIFSYQLRTV